VKKTVAQPQPQPQSGADKPDPAPLVRYEVTPTDIRAMAKRFSALTADTREGYESVRGAIATLRNTRVSVEKRRVELKASALAYGRRVDAIAGELTAALESVEEPLKLKKAAVDDERDRAKREKEAAERAAAEAIIRAEREAEEARLKMIRDAEEARLAAERAALAEERLVLEAQRRADRQRLADTHAQLERAEEALAAERARARAEEEAKAQAERDRVAAEKAHVAALERAERDRQRLEAIKPDIEKIQTFGATIRAIAPPAVISPEAAAAIRDAASALEDVAYKLEQFGS